MAQNKLDIISMAQTVYKKCECCNNVRDIFFKMQIFDSKTGKMLVGDFDLCKLCGENISDILNLKLETEHTLKEFTF